MNCKRKGSRAEHKSMKILEACGYAVTRSAASLGDWDLVGVSRDGFVLCQGQVPRFSRRRRDGKPSSLPLPRELQANRPSVGRRTTVAGC